ncbi:hypothetical protein PTMSG1_06489 [Pyrenophora teres f. maculata]|nr:hypothetical protein PTMSG1_06489 [Pyrenophora teres f. maculata]
MITKLLILVAILGALAASEVLGASLFNVSRPTAENDTVTVKDLPLRADDALWESAHCRGSKLFLCMTLNAPEAATVCQPITSQFDETFETDLRTWGWEDFSQPSHGVVDDCEMAGQGGHGLDAALQTIGADGGSSTHGGDNVCYMFEHRDGPAIIRDENGDLPEVEDQYYVVNGKVYRATGGIYSMGVNARSGIVYFINRMSPASMAEDIWGVPSVRPDELPKLRASSDIAWGIWRRRSNDLANINYFFSLDIANADTGRIIARAVEDLGYNYVPEWPGLSFQPSYGLKAFTAILGSPNSIGAGWFLAQHKAQMGQNRYIYRITVFTETGTEDYPHMLLWVKQAPPPAQFPPPTFPPGQGPPPSQNNRKRFELKSGDMEGVELVGPPTQDELDLAQKHIIWG